MSVIELNKLCRKGVSTLRQKDIANDGPYPVYGASGVVGYSANYQNEERYVAVIKDGAGVGRACACEPKSSVLGTMQALLPAEGVDCDYLLHLVRNMRLGDGFTGSTIPHVYFRDYGKRLLVKHGKSEQRWIAESLNAVETQTADLSMQIESLDELVKSRFVEMFGDPIENPNGWVKKPIGDVYEVGSAKRVYARDQVSEGVPFLRLGDLTNRIQQGVESCDLYIKEELYEAHKAKGLVPDVGDILVTARGTMGLCYEVKSEDRFYFQDGMITWLHAKPESPLPVFLINLFANEHFDEDLHEHTSGTTVKYLSIKTLSRLPMVMPPLALQQEFAAFVRQVDKLKFSYSMRFL